MRFHRRAAATSCLVLFTLVACGDRSGTVDAGSLTDIAGPAVDVGDVASASDVSGPDGGDVERTDSGRSGDDPIGDTVARDPEAELDRDSSEPQEDSGATRDVADPLDARSDDTGASDASDVSDVSVDGDTTGPACVPATASGPTILQTASGAVEGAVVDGTRRWLGVPYAAAPVGTLRWRPPAPATCRPQVLRANVPSPACPQRDPLTGVFSGGEDCLQLNLWVPDEAPPEGGWPVLVFVHGGGNVVGSADQRIGQTQGLVYDGARLAARGQIVVTLNYRLGALGWLALPALDAEAGGPSTNFALQDQQAALRWLRAHLPAVGGDAARVLLFGESAGAVNTLMHLVSPGSEGLFGAVAIMSGGATTRTLAAAQADATNLVAASSCAGRQGDALLACLRALSPEEVDRAFPGEIHIGSPQVRGSASSFGPVVDGVHLPEAPLERIASGRHHAVPAIIGTTAEEMAELLDTRAIRTEDDVARVVRAAFLPVVGRDGVDRILETYPVADYATPADALIALYSDARFVCPATRLLETLDAAQTAPVYPYWFSRRGVVPRQTLPAAHGRELAYLFGGLYRIPLFTPVPDDRAVADAMERAWTTFARDTVPSAGSGVEWDVWTPSRDNALVFDAPLSTLDGVRTAQCAMWSELTGR